MNRFLLSTIFLLLACVAIVRPAQACTPAVASHAHRAEAAHLTYLLAAEINLPAGPTRDAVERLIDRRLTTLPENSTAASPREVLGQLLRDNLHDFQRLLSPVLSEESYARYQTLLDQLHIVAD